MFSPAGPGVFPSANNQLWGLLGFLNSSVAGFYIELFVGGGDSSAPGTAARHFSPALIERLPVPDGFGELLSRLDSPSRDLHRQLQPFKWSEPSPEFLPVVLAGATLRDEASDRFDSYETAVLRAIKRFREIDEIVCQAYGLTREERDDLGRVFGRLWNSEGLAASEELKRKILEGVLNEDGSTQLNEVNETNLGRSATKLSFIADRRYENLASLHGVSPEIVAAIRRETGIVPSPELALVAVDVVSFAVGCAFGRWDIRFATGKKPVPDFPDPFAPLPVCPPGMLQNEHGLPLTKDDVRRLQVAAQWHYPSNFRGTAFS